MALKARRSGMLIFGGGLVKHHICNANLMRNGANHAVFINTGASFDGSDSGATPDEALTRPIPARASTRPGAAPRRNPFPTSLASLPALSGWRGQQPERSTARHGRR